MERILSALAFLAATCFCGDLFTGQDPTPHKTGPSQASQFDAPAQGERKIDGEDVPLPAHALARLGSTRWRHGSSIVRSALSADGKRLATVSTSSVAVWDVATGKVLFRSPTLSTQARSKPFSHYSGPKILAFSPDGKKLGMAFNDDFTGIWDLENGGKLRYFTGQNVPNSHGHCQFTCDGNLFILLYGDGIRFWDPITGKLRRQMPASFAVSDISADVQRYVQIDHDRDLKFNVRDFKTGATIKRFDIRAGEGKVIFTPDNKSLIVIDELKKEVQVWDAPLTQARCTFSLPQFAGVSADRWFPYHVCCSADGKVLMLANSKGHIHRWDLATEKELPVLTSYPGGIVGLHDLTDGRTLIAIGEDGLIHRFDTKTNREISDVGKYEGSLTTVVSPDGHLAAVGDSRGRLDLWELQPLKLRRTLRKNGPAVISAAFAADRKTLAVGLQSETVCLYDIASGCETRVISFKEAEQNDDAATACSTLLLSPDGRLLYVNSSAGELLSWDLIAGKARWRCKGAFEWDEGAAALSPDGKTLAFVPEGSEVLLLDAVSGNKRNAVKLAVTRSRGLEERVQSLAFSPDGRSLAVALGDGTIALVDPATAKEGKRLVTSFPAEHVAFSPDGRTIAVGMMESVCLLDPQTGKIVSRFEGHTDSVNSVSFGPKGRTLLSSGADSQVYFWSVETKSRP